MVTNTWSSCGTSLQPSARWEMLALRTSCTLDEWVPAGWRRAGTRAAAQVPDTDLGTYSASIHPQRTDTISWGQHYYAARVVEIWYLIQNKRRRKIYIPEKIFCPWNKHFLCHFLSVFIVTWSQNELSESRERKKNNWQVH